MQLPLKNKWGSLLALLALVPCLCAEPPDSLNTGVAEFAFDHLGGLSNLAAPAAACRTTVIYCSGMGPGYMALPDQKQFAAQERDSRAYLKQARSKGIQLAIGYVCATSMVDLKMFDRNWTPKFRAQFSTPPAQWRQEDKTGQPLPSWYGGLYEAACMNNPNWRAYEKFMVRAQLDSGCDGIFFDNPTVHPEGCYCEFCMKKFDAFLAARNSSLHIADHSVDGLRRWAAGHQRDFMEFRAGIAADFLADMREYARTIKRRALVTCNNSLNSPETLFAQCRADGYDIESASKSEDFLTIEDMCTQAGKRADGRVFEYGPTYKQLHAISHDKPIVACTLADADYFHTPPHLARLSMAEAAANDASWMLWPAWPDSLQKPMATAIFPEAEFLRRNAELLNNTDPCCDVLLYLPFRRWLDTPQCAVSTMAAALTRANIQYAVCSEENFADDVATGSPLAPVLLLESLSILNPNAQQALQNFTLGGGRVVVGDAKDWMASLRNAMPKPSLALNGPDTVRAVVRSQTRRVIVHLYNLDVQRLAAASDEDRVNPARQIGLQIRVPFERVKSVRALTADEGASHGSLPFSAQPDGTGSLVKLTYPRLEIHSILLIEP